MRKTSRYTVADPAGRTGPHQSSCFLSAFLLSVARGTLLFKPSFYQGMSAELCICACSIKSVRNHYAVRINANRPQVWLDADTNGVAHASVFHPLIVRRNRPTAVFIRRTPGL
jgi:hypothetical protein